jgi:hypothetical protein
MEFQTNYLAFMAAVQIWFHCCLVCTLQDPSIYKAHFYTLYVCTCVVYPQQMTIRISIVVIKQLCVQEGILHNIYIYIYELELYKVPAAFSRYLLPAVTRFQYIISDTYSQTSYANVWLNTPSGLMRQLKMSYNR